MPPLFSNWGKLFAPTPPNQGKHFPQNWGAGERHFDLCDEMNTMIIHADQLLFELLCPGSNQNNELRLLNQSPS